MKSRSFEAIAGPDARVLILGTLPGTASLACGQYYAQPRNAFWRLMGELVGAAPALPYAERVQRLVVRRVALWDVCAVARRRGSADAAIRPSTVRPNDLACFLRSHAAVELICFNGAKAGELFQRHVSSTLESPVDAIRQAVLPPTSPAHAAMPLESKLARWRAVLQDVVARDTDERFAQQAIELARRARVAGNHPFGALLVLDGEVILSAENTIRTDRDPTAHAESNLVAKAIRQLSPDQIRRSVLYTSCEPCAMCVGKMYWAGIRSVAYALPAQELAALAGPDFLIPCAELFSRSAERVAITGPLLLREAREVHLGFWPLPAV